MVKVTFIRPCMCEGFWVATVNTGDDTVKREGFAEYDMMLMEH